LTTTADKKDSHHRYRHYLLKSVHRHIVIQTGIGSSARNWAMRASIASDRSHLVLRGTASFATSLRLSANVRFRNKIRITQPSPTIKPLLCKLTCYFIFDKLAPFIL
jgi:hypothetical protein